MANDTPDWAGLYASPTFQTLTDVAELAVRLGSIVTHDRRGAVIWYDDFSLGLDAWEVSSVSGAGSTFSLVTSPIDRGPFAALLLSGATPAAIGIRHYVAIVPGTLVGLAASVFTFTDSETVTLELRVYQSGTRYIGAIRLNAQTNKLQLFDSSGAWVDFLTGLTGLQSKRGFPFIKLVLDIPSGAYERLIFGGVEYDLSAYALNSILDATASQFRITITHTNSTAANGEIYIDNVILTVNEPVNA